MTNAAAWVAESSDESRRSQGGSRSDRRTSRSVLGRWHAGTGKSTVLIYGHFDVQPADPIELWDSPPFEPDHPRRSSSMAAACADMKANLLSVIQAVEALAQETGVPPLNVTFLFEGEEEIGDSHLPEIVAIAERRNFRADVALTGDGSMAGEDLPVILVSAKGIAEIEIEIVSEFDGSALRRIRRRGPERHSGARPTGRNLSRLRRTRRGRGFLR